MTTALPGRGMSGTDRLPLLPAGLDRAAFGLLAAGFCLLYLPTYWDLAQTTWASDDQGHGPIILSVSAWLLFSKRHDLAGIPSASNVAFGWPVFLIGLLMYVLGRSQQVSTLEVGSQIPVLVGLLLLFRGSASVRAVWFPIFFLIFMVPLPLAFVAAITTPLKAGVSYLASELLHVMGYPVGRSGVTLTVGPYQLLVADACAGLNSMFTLESLGLLYMNLMAYTSVVRNVALAVLVIPIALVANVVRVLILVLVTYYFGDAAGQGFVHGFAGMVLFIAGLMMMLAVDKLLGHIIASGPQRRAG